MPNTYFPIKVYRNLLSNCTSYSTNNAQNEYKYPAVFVLQIPVGQVFSEHASDEF